MKISPFQALTILAKKFGNALPNTLEAKKFSQIQNLFLMGVQNDQDRAQLGELLNDEALKNWKVALGDKELINNDPARRYFESTLAHETLKATIDTLNMDTLNNHFKAVYAEMPFAMRFLVPLVIYKGSIDSKLVQASATAPEYVAALKKLQEPKNWSMLKPSSEEMGGASDVERAQKLQERLEKMQLLLKTVHAAMTAVNTGGNHNFPLNIYGVTDSPYSPERRGRKDRKDEANLPQVVKSTNLGIMRSYHPLTQDDPLYEDPNATTSGRYRRPADSSDYIPGAQMPEKFFLNEVSPFVNSISGTMLCQLRVMAKLLEKEKFEFNDNPDQLKAFFKSMVSYMIYNSGGHSFQEFMSVLDLEQVKEMFKNVPGFDEINLRTLFQDENEEAFRRSINSVINYNDRLLARRTVQEELGEPELKRQLNEGEDELTVRARSHLKPALDGGEVTSLMRKNLAIDRAYQAYTNPRYKNETIEEYNKRIKEAEIVLVKKLNIKVDATDVKQQIMSRIIKREDELQNYLYSSGKTLPQRLDYAYDIYKNEEKTVELRGIAQSFLIYVLDIKTENIEKNLNDTIGRLMLERELLKKTNPDYIPGKSPLNIDEKIKAKLQRTMQFGVSESEEVNNALASKDLLDVNPLSKRKDRGELTGKKTVFFNEQERDMFRVLISQGKFVQNGIPIDTSESISHGKKGFAAFTLNVNGELSVFQHIDHDKTGIAHSSMNKGAPVVGAGEIRIEKGKLISITDHSGHYRPSLYNTYKVLEYFKKQGIDIDGVKILTLANPSKLNILHPKSKEFPRFKEMLAEDLCDGYKTHLKAVLLAAKQDFEKYQSPGIQTFIGYIKDWILGTTTTKDRIAFAKSMVNELALLYTELSQLKNPEEVKQFGGKLQARFLGDQDAASKNRREDKEGKANNQNKSSFFSPGKLEKQVNDFHEKLKSAAEYENEEYTSSLKNINRT